MRLRATCSRSQRRGSPGHDDQAMPKGLQPTCTSSDQDRSGSHGDRQLLVVDVLVGLEDLSNHDLSCSWRIDAFWRNASGPPSARAGRWTGRTAADHSWPDTSATTRSAARGPMVSHFMQSRPAEAAGQQHQLPGQPPSSSAARATHHFAEQRSEDHCHQPADEQRDGDHRRSKGVLAGRLLAKPIGTGGDHRQQRADPASAQPACGRRRPAAWSGRRRHPSRRSIASTVVIASSTSMLSDLAPGGYGAGRCWPSMTMNVAIVSRILAPPRWGARGLTKLRTG